jgi:hypothetical protein
VGVRSPRFGNVVVLVFLVTQICDGVFTYIGVAKYGPRAEGNPLLTYLMGVLGTAGGVAAAKATGGAAGIALRLVAGHRVVAALAALYLAVAILPWVHLLFF